MPIEPARLEMLSALARKVLWLSSWTIHHANHIRPNADGLKVGGHQASSASLATIMSALYFSVLKPEDRVAVKPHASPVFHAIQYLFGHQSRDKLENFRGFKGAQSYPSRTKDTDDVDFSTGSVGLGVAQTLFSSLVQDYVKAHGWMKDRPEGRMIALVGDAEMDEGNIFEALLEGWKHGLRNTWWVVDYNRQSLDAVVREGLWEKFESMFRNFGWDVVIVKYGRLMQAAFAEPGGEALKRWIDACPNAMYAALCFQGGAAFRKHLRDEIGDQGAVSQLIERRSDDELLALMSNLGGHDMASMIEAFEAIDHDRPVCFIAYTIKGIGLPFQGHKDNHAGLMTPTQMEKWRAAQNIRPGHEWEKFEGLSQEPAALEAFLADAPFNRDGRRRLERAGDRRAGAACVQAVAADVDPAGLWARAQRTRARRYRTRLAHRHRVARRHGVDQSRRLGQPARAVRARREGRPVPQREDTLDLQLGLFTEGTAHRTRHRRDEPVHPDVGAGAVASHQRRTAVADRHPVRSLHRARPRCPELRLLPGRALHGGGDAVGHYAGAGGRRASVDRDAPDRHGAGWPRLVRAGLCRRTRRHHGLGIPAHAARRRRGRLGLLAAFDPHARPAAADDDAGSAKGHHRRRLLAAQARDRIATS